MGRTVKTILSLVISLLLLGAVALAEAGKPAKKDKNDAKEHHSRFAKAAFWRHHGNKSKDGKKSEDKQAQSKQPRIHTAQPKPVVAKQASQKEKTQVSKASKVPAKKAPARTVASSKPAAHLQVAKAHGPVKHHATAKATTAHEKAQHRTTASVR